MKWVLALLGAVGIALLLSPWLLTPPADLILEFEDEVFASSLAGRPVTITDRRSDRSLRRVVEPGAGAELVAVRVASGEVRLEVAVERFRPRPVELVAGALEEVRVRVGLTPTFGRLRVAVVDARRPDRPLTARHHVSMDGERLTPRRGLVELFLEAGRYAFDGSAEGYCSAAASFTVRAAETTEAMLPLPPVIGAGERARVLLDWGPDPRDLDSHVVLSGSSRRVADEHIYFGNKEGRLANGALFAELDVDWTRSEGKEAITLYDSTEGTFQYFVHLYAGEGTMEDSGARVEVITAGCEGRAFDVPAACSERWWHVVDVVSRGGAVEVLDREQCRPTPPAQYQPNPK